MSSRPRLTKRRGTPRGKRLGQHFLTSPRVLALILRESALEANDTILEIGPGPGGLTIELARRAKRVIAVEKDRMLAARLGERLTALGIENVEVVRADILRVFPDGLNLPSVYRIIANIPYYLTSRLIRRLLEVGRRPRDAILMVQKEVAERILAKPPSMNLLGLAVQSYGRPRLVAVIPPEAFSPPPAVHSAIIAITDVSGALFRTGGVRPEALFQIARAAFLHRRKTLRNSLATIAGGKAAAEEALERSGIRPEARPESLAVLDWFRLTRELSQP